MDTHIICSWRWDLSHIWKIFNAEKCIRKSKGILTSQMSAKNGSSMTKTIYSLLFRLLFRHHQLFLCPPKLPSKALTINYFGFRDKTWWVWIEKRINSYSNTSIDGFKILWPLFEAIIYHFTNIPFQLVVLT